MKFLCRETSDNDGDIHPKTLISHIENRWTAMGNIDITLASLVVVVERPWCNVCEAIDRNGSGDGTITLRELQKAYSEMPEMRTQ